MLYGSSNTFTYAMSGSALQTASQQPGPTAEPQLAPYGSAVYLYFDKAPGTPPFFFDKFSVLPNADQTASARIYSGHLTYEGGSRDITYSEADDMTNGRPVNFTIVPSGHSLPANIYSLTLMLNLYGSPSALYFENQYGPDDRGSEISADLLKGYYGTYEGYNYQGTYVWLPYQSSTSTPIHPVTYYQQAGSTHTLQIRTTPYAVPNV